MTLLASLVALHPPCGRDARAPRGGASVTQVWHAVTHLRSIADGARGMTVILICLAYLLAYSLHLSMLASGTSLAAEVD